MFRKINKCKFKKCAAASICSLEVQNLLKSCLKKIEEKRNKNNNNVIVGKPNNNNNAKAQINNNNIIIKKVDNKKDQNNNNINNNIIKKVDNKKDQNINNINKIENNNVKKVQNNKNTINEINIEDYEIKERELKRVEKIGKGGFGEVYRGTWKNKIVAIKVIEFKNFNTDVVNNTLYNFQREATILMNLSHPNIVQFHGVSIVDKHCPAIVMEYCDKGSLWGLLHDVNSKLNGSTSMKIAWDCAKGIAYLHERKIFHRDIKSQNILLVEVNRSYVAKIADFGLSKLVTDDEPWTWCGTRPWMAPEFFKEEIILTNKTDIYAFGVVYWEICTRKSPGNRKINDEVNEDDFDNYIPNPKKVAKFIQWCTRPKPENRPNDNQVVEECEKLYKSSLQKK